MNDETKCANYLGNLSDSFRFLAERLRLNGEHYHRLYDYIALISTFKSGNQKNFRLSINPNITTELTSRTFCGPCGITQLTIGGEINVKNNKLESQSITVCISFAPYEEVDRTKSETHGCPQMNANTIHIVRRFHFDYDANVADKEWTVNHLQYGGKFDSRFLKDDFSNCQYSLFANIEIPRIPTQPFDLILVFDLFFRQMPSDMSDIHKEGQWNNMVLKSENIWLRDFYRKLASHLNNKKRKESLHQFSISNGL